MAREHSALLNLAESVADGAAIDWDTAEREASDADRPVIRQLRVLATLGLLHRTLPAIPEPPVPASRSVSAPAIGKWGQLSLLERLGGGTFGDVYRAWDAQLEREVALKLLRDEDAALDPNGRQIVQEARRLARIRHQNVVTVYGVDAHDGHVGLWMELIQGTTLEQAIAKHGAFSAREAVIIGVDLCHALAAIHGAGLLHRDIKAQNVMREDGGRIVLMDLGTGREMSAGGPADLAGTPLYLAPEIFDGHSASVESDLYSLGVLLYRMVTGEFPVRATTIDGLRQGHTERSMVHLRDARPDLPTAFVQVVDRALHPEPAKRYHSAGSLEADLVRTLDSELPAERREEKALPRHFAWSAAALAITVIVLVGFAAFSWRVSDGGGATTSPIRTIAVLPLENDSGDPTQDYFAEGMTDQIISMLGRLDGLTVISRTSSTQFKGMQIGGKAQSLPQIAAALKADAVIEGSVVVLPPAAGAAAAGKRVRINARLIAAGTDTQIWTQTFEAVADDILTLERQVAKAIADGIRFRLSPDSQGALTVTADQTRAPDFEAFNLYLRGRHYWNLRTKEGLERSIQYFHQAIEHDATYAAPHAGLADAYVLLTNYGAMPFQESLSRASVEAERALRLDESTAEAHASLGLIHDARLEWDEAEMRFQRAIDLNPGYASAHHWYAAHMARMARFPEARAEIEKAIELDPLSVGLQTQLGSIHLMARDYDRAITQIEIVLQGNPTFARAHFILAQARAKKGDIDRALADAERATEFGGGDAELRGLIGCILATAGRAAEARAIAEELAGRYRDNREGGPVNVAAIYASLRDNDRAFEWLEKGREERDPLLGYLKVDPWFDNLRDDPRFDALLATLALKR